ncbi:hypothetical protein PR048_011526 [Dryococelus australis]|uniref:Integrase zinc-binding domain-containing protein n=1 Tax=Dryococelus australis TaxID=614101 RepID=A0ABQ9HLS3_9NEOP|nr:hypothetical protein PR048_011526 [Dryococelus australis]
MLKSVLLSKLIKTPLSALLSGKYRMKNVLDYYRKNYCILSPQESFVFCGVRMKKVRPMVLHYFHDCEIMGHTGIVKTKYSIKKDFFDQI